MGKWVVSLICTFIKNSMTLFEVILQFRLVLFSSKHKFKSDYGSKKLTFPYNSKLFEAHLWLNLAVRVVLDKACYPHDSEVEYLIVTSKNFTYTQKSRRTAPPPS